MGTPDFAIPSLEKLFHSDNEILCVYTRPDGRQGRGKKKSISNLKKYCLDNNIPVRQPESFKNNHLELNVLQKFKPDIGVVVAFGNLLPLQVLQSFKHGCINVHPSMLPKYRGPSPVITAILNGETTTGVSIIQLDEGMDSGPIILQDSVIIEKYHDSLTLTNLLFDIGGDLLIEAITQIKNGTLKLTFQMEREASYTQKINKSDGEINWSLSAYEINQRIRAFYPWPGSYTHIDGKLLKIMTGRINSEQSLHPGNIKMTDEIKIGTGKGTLIPELLQLEGKKIMTSAEFLRGNKHLDGTYANND